MMNLSLCWMQLGHCAKQEGVTVPCVGIDMQGKGLGAHLDSPPQRCEANEVNQKISPSHVPQGGQPQGRKPTLWQRGAKVKK